MQKLITLTTDFGVQTQGIGHMKIVLHELAPEARVIDLMHGLPAFDITAAARTLETLHLLDTVGIHVCVCDPGVGTERKGIALKVKRGDIFVGPDNGVFLPAARLLGGIVSVHEITAPEYMRPNPSPLFHGRDVFSPAAAHLVNGLDISKLGAKVPIEKLVQAPYDEAKVENGRVNAQVIQINHFGSPHLNILGSDWDKFGFGVGDTVRALLREEQQVGLTYTRTFGDVPIGENVVMKDDYGRIEIAENMGRFADQHSVKLGDRISIQLPC